MKKTNNVEVGTNKSYSVNTMFISKMTMMKKKEHANMVTNTVVIFGIFLYCYLCTWMLAYSPETQIFRHLTNVHSSIKKRSFASLLSTHTHCDMLV